MTYAQTAVKVEELRLPGLDGMLPGGNVKARKKVTLDYLMDAGEKVVEKYYSYVEEEYSNDQKEVLKAYYSMYSEVETILLRDVVFDERDLRDYIEIKSDLDLDERRTKVLGLYTGCLLELLTGRNEAAGLSTNIYLNGHGRKFSYLFSHARKTDKLFINNFKGRHVCYNVGSYGGYVNSMIIVNGEGVRAGDSSGKKGGNVGLCLVVNQEGISPGGGVAFQGGNVNLLILANNKGCFAGDYFLEYSYGGSFGLVLQDSNEGQDILHASSGIHANVGLFVAANNKTNHNACRPNQNEKGVVKKLVFYNNIGESHDRDNPNISPENMVRGERNIRDYVEEIVKGEAAAEEYEQIMQQYSLRKIIHLAESVTKDSSDKEIGEVAGQIYSIYESIKPKLEELKQDAIRTTNSKS